MLIQYTLKNDRTGQIKKPMVDDTTSPSSGWTQSYADRSGAEYAADRAKAMLNSPLHPHDTWTFVSAEYQSL